MLGQAQTEEEQYSLMHRSKLFFYCSVITNPIYTRDYRAYPVVAAAKLCLGTYVINGPVIFSSSAGHTARLYVIRAEMREQPAIASSELCIWYFGHGERKRNDMLHVGTPMACSVGIRTESGKQRNLIMFELMVGLL
jgi:hypothetical protein